MPVAKTVTLAQAKAAQQTAKENETSQTQKAQENTSQPTTQHHTPDIREKVEPSEQQLQEEEKKALAILEAQDGEDPDEKKAREIKQKIAEEKAEKSKRKPSTSRKSKGLKDRKCERCEVIITPKDPRTRMCKACAKKAFDESKSSGGQARALDQKETEEKLRPFLRLGLNLKESCLEAEVGYSTILEKTKTWTNFAEFIERHQNYAIIKAKRNIFNNLGANDKETVGTSKWLLERRRPNEYGPKVDITGSLNHIEQLSPEKQAILAALIAQRQ
jgi:hypothetical protein